MLENERIIVQDRGGIDAGIAALMQNANLIHLVETTP